MKIQSNYINYSPNFGIKVPTKVALEAATGTFLENAQISYPRQTKLLSRLGKLNTNKLYSGEMTNGLRNMSKVICKRHPEIATSAEKIKAFCNSYNMKRTFLPEDEARFSKELSDIVENEINTIGKNEINIEAISLKELGLEKYENI